MALFTYNPALATDLDWIRLLIGDTRAASPELDDQEIEGLLADTDEPDATLGTDSEWRAYRYKVAARAADIVAAKHAMDPADVSFEGQRVALSSKYAQYTTLAKRLRAVSTSYAVMRLERW